MNIAINIDGQFGAMTGVQHYVDSLLQALLESGTAHRIAAFLPRTWSPALWDEAAAGGRFAWRSHPRARVDSAGNNPYLSALPAVAARPTLRTLAARVDRRLIRPLQARAGSLAEWQARRTGRRYDLLHTPGVSRAESLTYRGRRNVATVYDLTTLTHAWAHQPDNIALSQRFYDYARRCDRVLTISEWSRQDIVAYLGIPDDRIDVTPLAPRASTRPVADPDETRPVREALRLADTPFVLYAGTLEPRKNLKRLIQAFALAVAEGNLPDHLLVLAGGCWDRYPEELRALADAAGVGERLRLPGYVSDHAMNVLMSACAAFAYVSEYEGFGMPPLEAMTCGAPVVASSASSLPEVVGDAALSVPPSDTQAIAAALHRLLTDPEENARRRRLSRARAQQFSWARTAALTLQSYEAANA